MTKNRNILLRRIAALLLFAILLMAFAGLFLYKIVPDNRSDLNQRAHSVLTQQVQNFLRKDLDLHNIIENADSAHFPNLEGKLPPYDRLFANLHYDTTTDLPPAFPSHLKKTDTGVWLIVHHRETDLSDTGHKRVYLTVKMKDFADPLFAGLNDVFKDYLILLDSTDSTGTGENSPAGLSLLYQQSPLSASARFNADTMRSLAANSDQSGAFELSMAGHTYMAFFSRFEFHRHPLVLIGLIEKEEYVAKINATPPLFLPLIIILICVSMISLPFLKVFLLSPREPINSQDVFKMALSFYAGGVAITIIVFYFFLSYVTDLALEHRLQHFSYKVKTDLEQDIRDADAQLKHYDSLFGVTADICNPIKIRLATSDRVFNDPLEFSVDNLCIPAAPLQVSRIIWLDTCGNTIAKWSPYSYPTPFTPLSNYAFFQQLLNKPPWYNGVAGVDAPVVYPGKSNLTDEFQTFIARQSRTAWPGMKAVGQHTNSCPGKAVGCRTDSCRPCEADTSVRTIVPASFIAIAAMLHSTMQPVIPPGFGFSIIDNNGNILIDADGRRSLGGNLFDEAGQNKDLAEAVRFDKSSWTFPLEFRGESRFARVRPIEGQPLHLVCYYSRNILRNSVNRMMHFAIESLALMWCLLAICLVLSTYQQWKPVLLKFNFDKIEWIRPSSNNQSHLAAIYTWLVFLALAAIGWMVGISLTSATLMPLFFLSILVPFFVVLGIQVFHRYKGKRYTIVVLVLLNFIIALLIKACHRDWGLALPVAGFELIALYLLRLARKLHPLPDASKTTESTKSTEAAEATEVTKSPKRRGRILDRVDKPLGAIWQRFQDRWPEEYWEKRRYYFALFFSILLIGILPTLGILNYAFFAEKVQYKKAKLDAVATAFTKRSNYLLNNLLPSCKQTVLKKLSDTQLKKLLFNTSIYLTDIDDIQPATAVEPAGKDTAELPDALYDVLMDDCYFAPVVWQDQATIPDGGHQGHGVYRFAGNKAIWYEPGRLLGTTYMGSQKMVASSQLQKPHRDLFDIFFSVGLFALFALIVLAVLAAKLVRGAINHLFLMEIVDNAGRMETKDIKPREAFEKFKPTGSSWLKIVNELKPLQYEDLAYERSFDNYRLCPDKPKPDAGQRTEFILAMTDYLAPAYQVVWDSLGREEQYVLFDFASDRYTNYKNSAVLYRLISKGVLEHRDGYLDVFSLSFRQFVLNLPDGDNARHLAELQREFRVPGTWQSIRVPAIAILLVMGVFLFTTQPQLSTFVTGLALLATSLTTVIGFVRSSLPDTPRRDGDEGKEGGAADAGETSSLGNS